MTAQINTLTVAQALSILASGDYVHNCGAGPVIIGCDWLRSDAEAEIAAAQGLYLAGPMARATGHGLAVHQASGRSSFFATDEAAIAALEAEVSA